ncbi:MAG TPA: FecR domain-containing protein [Rhizomicrobium sp.]|nr:FecR domain-containing protein [Rhizomicrobium sp.]
MSGLVSEPVTAESIDELSRVAADWIERRDFGSWEKEDQAEFDAWLCASPAHRIAFLRLEAGWKRTELLGALRPFRIEQAAHAHDPRGFLMKLAASIALVAAIGAGAAQYVIPQPKIYTTGVGGRETLRLSDGTLIDLNTDTRIRLSGARGERTVWLEKGEAYFQVKHDPAHPFVVIAANRRITDIGTEFLIRNDPRRLEVALVEGRARFEDGQSVRARSFTLKPGEVVVSTPESLRLTAKSQQDLADELGWRRGVLVFNHTTLADAAAEFNRYNSRKIVLADDDVARRVIGGAFTVTDVHRFALVVRDALKLGIKDRNGDIVISREP